MDHTGFTMTYGSPDRHDGSLTQGGYSDRVVVSERFVLRMPEGIDLKSAAPLLCAGITTYSPLKYYGEKPGGKAYERMIKGGVRYRFVIDMASLKDVA